MKLKDIIAKLDLKVLTAQSMLESDVRYGYASDLLSDVMAHAQQGDLWITLQTHQNTIAVAKLKELSGIILVNKRMPDEETIKKAEEEKVPLLSTSDTAFVTAGKLYRVIYGEE